MAVSRNIIVILQSDFRELESSRPWPSSSIKLGRTKKSILKMKHIIVNKQGGKLKDLNLSSGDNFLKL